MAWIDEIEVEHADGELADLYQAIVRKRGKVANILKVHSLNPGALSAHLELYMTLLFGRSGLSRAEREAIAVVTSSVNQCEYCVSHHTTALGQHERDPSHLGTIQEARDFAGLPGRTIAILRHARKLTATPAEITDDDLDALRAHGLSDRDILDTTLVTAYFNFVNRIALGLGVAHSEEEQSGYKA